MKSSRAVLLIALIAAACKSDGGNGPTPSIALSLSKSAASIVQGGSDQLTATVTRTDFSGAVDITVTGAPTGVTGTVSNVTTTGNAVTATVTISVAASTAPGNYTLTAHATGDGVTEKTASLALTVTAIPAIGLSLSHASVSIEAGASGTTDVTITRTNFTAAVTLSLEGAPSGVSASFNPAAPTGTSSTLTITVDAAVTPGDYDLTVKGTGSGVTDAAAPLTLTVTAPPVGSYTLGVSPNPVSIQQGAAGPVTVSITRDNFTDDVALSVTGAPTGVTAAFNPATLSGSTASSQLTLTVDGAVAAGDVNLTVKGTVAGRADVTVPLTLTVTAAPVQGFSLSATAAAAVAGSSGNSTVTITRTGGFSGTVHLTVQTAPSGVTGSFNPTDATGTSSALTLQVNGSVAPGDYTVTIKGTSSGEPDATADLGLTVSAPSGGSITWDFSNCNIHPIWFAAQDGSGSWTQVVGANNVFSFNSSSGTAAVAYTINSGVNSTVLTVVYLTHAEIAAGFTGCVPPASGKSITGTAAGLGAQDAAYFSLGGAFASATSFGTLFTLQTVPLGTFDLFGYRRSFTTPGVGDKLLITRDVNTNSISTVGTQDFGGGSAIDPVTANLTISGGGGGEQFQVGMNYLSGAACTQATLYSGLPDANATQAMFGVPAADQRGTDYHQVMVTAGAGSATYRSAMESFQTMADRTVALPSQLPGTAPTDLGGPYKRLQYQITLPSDLLALASFSYTAFPGGTHSVVITATSAFIGGSALNLMMPDLSGVGGFDMTWVPASSATVNWSALASGAVSVNPCVEGARSVLSVRNGTF